MRELGILGAMHRAIGHVRAHLRLAQLAALAFALLLPATEVLAGASPAVIIGGQNQLAAPGQKLPQPIQVQNTATFPQDLRLEINFDNTGGATLNAGAAVVDFPNVPASGVVSATVTLGGAPGTVFLHACVVDGVGACVAMSDSFTSANTATLDGLGASGNVEAGESFSVEVEGKNGGTVPMSPIPVQFTVTGPASPASLDTTSNYMAPASLPLSIDPMAPGGAVITVSAIRTDVTPPPPAVVYTYTVNDYAANQISPPDGTVATAASTVTLTMEALYNGGPPNGENASRVVRWDIVQDPSGNATLSGGVTSTTTNINPGETQTSIDLTIGMPNIATTPIRVVATAYDPPPLPPRGQGLLGPSPSPNARPVEFVIDPIDNFAVTLNAGDGQTADVGQPLPTALSLIIRRNGAPDTGQMIDWSVSPPNAVTFAGGASTAQSTIDSTGTASISVTSVNTAGAITVTAQHANEPTVTLPYSVTGVGVMATFDNVTGDNQSAAPGVAFAQPLRLRALRNNVEEVGALINWTVNPPNAASVDFPQTATDNLGFTQVNVTAGPVSGPFTVTASRNDNPAVTQQFNLNIADRLLVKPGFGSGDGQIGRVNEPLPQALVAQATFNGTAEPNVVVNWSIVSGDATITSTTSPTDAGGQSTAQITLGSTPGPVQIQAQRADTPSQIQLYRVTAVEKRLIKPNTGSGDGQTGTPGQPLGQPLVAVATLNGSPEPDVLVNWSIVSGDATVASTSGPTDSTGRSSANITFGPSATAVTVQAQRQDVPSEIQTYTLTAANTRSLVKPSTGSGDNQSGNVGSTLPERLVVIALNNGVAAPGVVVQWAVVGGSATLSNDVTTSGADGTSSVQVTLGNTPGTITVRATRADDPNASSTFVLTATSIVNPTLGLEKPENSGDGARAQVGQVVGLSARAVIGTSPQAGIEVIWELVSGSAQLLGVRDFTDSSGLVSTSLRIGPNPGPIVVRAVRTDSGAAQTYQLTGVGSANELLEIVDGNNQTGAPGSAARPLRVRYTDGTRPIANATVNWQVLGGSATLAGASSTTDSDGFAQIGLTFGNDPGEVQVRASAGGASATFALRVGTPGLALRLVSGNRQTGAIGSRAALPMMVEVSDGLGVVLAGRAVQWTVVQGSATLDNVASNSDAAGLAQMGFRFGSSAGPVKIRAELPGVTPAVFVEFDHTAFTPTFRIVSGNNQSAAPGSQLPQDFVVEIGQPTTKSLAGVTVRWQVTAGGGTLASATSLTDANGRATNRLTLGANASTHTVTASLDNGPTLTFTATSVLQAGSLIIIGGNNQTLPTRTDSAPMVVELKNTAGVAIRGASLLWTAENAQLRSVRTTTDDSGRASNVAQVQLPGDARITVQVEGSTAPTGTTVVFALSGGVANIPQLGGVEETIGDAIDNLCPALVSLANPTPEQIDLRARCLELVNNAGSNPQQVEQALEQLREDVALAQANAALLSASAQFDNLKTRIAALRSGARGADFGGLAIANSSGVMPLSFLPSTVVQADDETQGGSAAEVGGEFSRWGFFASGIVGRGEQDAGSVTPEYDYDTTGLTAGVDYRVNDRWIVGASLGFNKQDTTLADAGGGIDTDGWSLSGYTTWYNDNWYVDGVLTLGDNDYDMRRGIDYAIGSGTGGTQVSQTARASTGGDVVSAALSVGRDFNKGAWNFGPYLRATYTSVEFDAYEEELDAGVGSGLGLAVEARELKSATGVIGGKVTYAMSRDWGILMPHAQLEYEHEFRDDPQAVVTRFLHDPTGTRIRLEGDEIDTSYFNVGFGLSAVFPGGRSAFFYYEHLAGSEGQSQDNLSIGIRIEF